MDDRRPIGGRDLDGGVDGTRRRSADQERQGEARALHLPGHVDHFVEGRRDEAGKADHARSVLLRGREDAVGGHHDAEIDDLVPVALEHDAHDVLPDVVDVALHGREKHRDLGGHCARLFLGLEVGLQVRDGLLHDARALDDLRKEHLPGPEEIANHVHAGHQRPLDDGERRAVLPSRLLDVGLDEVDDAFDKRVRQALLDGAAPPGVGQGHDLGLVRLLHGLGERDEALRGVRAAVQEDILDEGEEVLRDLLVDRELARVHDAHVEAGPDRVIEERRVHRLADRVVAAEREGDVGHAARDLRVRERRLDSPRGLEEIQRVGVVLLDAGRDREDVRIEDDVFGWKADLLGEDAISARGDRDLALHGRRLPVLVERHDDDRGPVTAHEARVTPEGILALLQADRVHDGLALEALQPGLDHVPFRAVEHDRKLRDVGLGREEVQEARHRRLPVQHSLVHVDVEDVRSPLDLLPRDRERPLVVARQDELRELRRPGDVRALADDGEHFGPERVGLETREARLAPGHRKPPRGQPLHGVRDRADVRRRRAAAAPHDVHPALAREGADVSAHDLGRLVEAAKGVGQSCIGIRAQEHRREAGQLLDVGPHLLRTERAVDADRQERRVRDGIPERLDHLARERPPRLVRDRDGDHERNAPAGRLEVLERGKQGRLEDEGVEDRLEEQEVDPAVEEPPDLLGVGRDELVEDVGPLSRVVHVHGERQGPVRGADRARDERVFPRGGAMGINGAAGGARGRDVHLVRKTLEAVVGE